MIVASVLAAGCASVRLVTPACGSYASAERPAASAALPSSSATLILKPFSMPVAADDSAIRVPEESVTRVAETPALAALIASRMPASVLALAPKGIVMSEEPAFGTKAVCPAFQLPSRIVMLPVPTRRSRR